MIALSLTILTIPALLMNIEQASCSDIVVNCAFKSVLAPTAGDLALVELWRWIGFFGVELVKAIPFVDWSEVFHVSNGSVIQPASGQGAQIIFAVRVILDILILAGLVRVLQINSRLRIQRQAFEAGWVPILEPFTEREVFDQLAAQIDVPIGLHVGVEPSVLDFPKYDETRLKELVQANDLILEDRIRRVAATLLSVQHSSPANDALLAETSKSVGETLNRYLENAASRETRKANVSSDRIVDMAIDESLSVKVRNECIRHLGRAVGSREISETLIGILANENELLSMRISAGRSLLKHHDDRVCEHLEGLASKVSDPGNQNAAALCAAMGYTAASADRILEGFCKEIALQIPEDLLTHFETGQSCFELCPGVQVAAHKKETLRGNVMLDVPVSGHDKMSFTMGNGDTPDSATDYAWPQYKAEIKQPFRLSRHTVSKGEYLAYAAIFNIEIDVSLIFGDDTSMIFVNWYDSVRYCDWLSDVTGEICRLPSETEWEFACRAGTSTKFWWGDQWDGTYAHSVENQSEILLSRSKGHPNPWGLVNMIGNVSEWCIDAWHDNYAQRFESDGSGWFEHGDFKHRVVRGGSWTDLPQDLTCYDRNGHIPTFRGNFVGFRVAQTISERETG